MLLGYLLEQWELDNCIPIEEDDLYDEVYGKYFDYIENYDFVKKLHYPYPDDALIKRRILEEEQWVIEILVHINLSSYGVSYT